MRPSFHTRLINDPFSDPGLFIHFLFEKRALLFDLGNLDALTSKDLLKISHVFVTHAHMDHFIGFDTLVRLLLGRNKVLHLFGPEHFSRHIEGRLSGYNWNLVNDYLNDFRIVIHEIQEHAVLTKTYACRDRFISQEEPDTQPLSGAILEEPSFSVQCTILDHRIPCLAFSMTENFYVNINKEALKELGLPVGPWLTQFKTSVYEKQDPDTDFTVRWNEKDGRTPVEKVFLFGNLVEKIAKISRGQKITYIADSAGSRENYDRIVNLARGSDLLFIEAAFMESEKELARKKYHLTAREAGMLARKAGVKQFRLFHFSPRYRHCAHELEREARNAFIQGE
jgi:ribonuclease Z